MMSSHYIIQSLLTMLNTSNLQNWNKCYNRFIEVILISWHDTSRNLQSWSVKNKIQKRWIYLPNCEFFHFYVYVATFKQSLHHDIVQLLQCFRACNWCYDFLDRWLQLTRKQEFYIGEVEKSTLLTFYESHDELVDHNGMLWRWQWLCSSICKHDPFIFPPNMTYMIWE